MQQLSGFLSIKEICEWKCSDCGLDVEVEGGAARVCSIYAQTSSLQNSLAEIMIMGDIQKEKKKKQLKFKRSGFVVCGLLICCVHFILRKWAKK